MALMNVCTKHPCRIISLALVASFFLPLGCFAGDRPGFMGCELAYPVSFPDSLPVLGPADFTTGAGFAGEIVVGSDGQVRQIRPLSGGDTAFVNRHLTYLEQISFESGRYRGDKVEQTLPFRCWRNPREDVLHLDLPVDSSHRISETTLYFQALRLNGVQPAKLMRFPSYFIKAPDTTETESDLPYILAEVGIDTAGRLQNIKVLHTDSTGFVDQILSAVNWAEFRPKTVESGPQESTGYILLRLFPNIDYPTNVLSTETDSLPLYDRLRVQYFPDTVGMMSLPVPTRFFKDGTYSLPDGRLTAEDTIGAVVAINADGFPTSCNAVGADRQSGQALRAMVAKLRFWPALDFSGRGYPFKGLIRFEPVTSTIVRVRFTWLAGEGF